MSESLDDYARSKLARCVSCGGYRCDCATRQDTVGVERHDDTLIVTVPPQPASPDLERAVVAQVDEMIRQAGGDPTDWVIGSLRVNKWEAQPGGGEDPIWLTQIRATCTQTVPREETEWWRLVEALRATADKLPRPSRVPRKRTGKTRLIVCMGDDQAPHNDPALHAATCKALREMQPDGLIYMGDGIDLSNLGQWAAKKAGTRFEAEINPSLQALHTILDERLDAAGLAPGDDLHYLYGNHEARLLKELQTKVPQLVGLKQVPGGIEVLDVAFLAGLDRLGFQIARDPAGDYPHGTVTVTEGLLASHGWIVNKGAGASARKSIEHLESSLLVGHSHRLAITHVTRWGKDGPRIYTAGETGTMADLTGLGYARNPDWQGGFLTVTVDRAGFNVEPAVWRDRVLRWRGEGWGA